jgi:excisionase family DNA binding protein
MLKVDNVILLSMTEAVRLSGVSKEALRRAIRNGQLPAISAGRRTYLKPEDVMQWKERHYREFRAKAVKVRWERYRKQKAQAGEVKSDEA